MANTIPVRKIPNNLVRNGDMTLSQTISLFSDIHTPLFAFNKEGELLGLLTLNESLLKRKYSPRAIVSSRIISPPRISHNTPSIKILEMMRDYDLYSLPVMAGSGKIEGMVTAQDLLKQLLEDREFSDRIASAVSLENVITLRKTDTVKDAYLLFSQHPSSPLIVVDDDSRAIGILTKVDILSLYLTPSNKQRLSKRNPEVNISLNPEKSESSEENIPATKFMKPIHNYFKEDIPAAKMIRHLLDIPYDAVLLTDHLSHPRAQLTLRSVLQTILEESKKAGGPQIILDGLPGEISAAERTQINDELTSVAKWIDKQQRVQRVRFFVEIAYSPERKPNTYETSLQVITDNGELYAEEDDRVLMRAVRELGREVRKMARSTFL